MSKALENLDASIENQKKRLEQLKARKQQIEARLKSAEKQRARKEETRRKILAGAFFLEMVGDDVLDFVVNGKTLKAFLTRSDDKVLFGLVEGIQHETSDS
jgi:DNA repair exonuclease SbcCD ATPase subunit